MRPIAVVDYGAGNLRSVIKGFAAVGASATRATRPADLDGAAGIVVPGVGHFRATRALDAAWRHTIVAAVESGTPVFGICLGMQWLFEGSDEAAADRGLGVLRGRSRRLAGDVKIPHVGWNQLDRLSRPSRLLDGVPDGAAIYFSHTFAAGPTSDTIATTTHGATFASVVERGLVFGIQGHPEKSGAVGLRVLANFVEIARGIRRW